MERRKFLLTSLGTSAAVAFGTNSFAGFFAELTAKQQFNFMNTTHPNLTLINDFFQAYGKNDLEGIKKVLDENIKWHIPGKHPLSGTKTGVKEVLEYFQQLHKGAFKAEPIVMGVNDNFVIDCHRNWSNLEKEENLNSMSCLLWRIENNKIVEVHNFPENQHKVDAFFSKVYK